MIAKAAQHAKALPWAACARWGASGLLAIAPLLLLHWCDLAQRPAPPVLHLELTRLPATRPARDDDSASAAAATAATPATPGDNASGELPASAEHDARDSAQPVPVAQDERPPAADAPEPPAAPLPAPGQSAAPPPPAAARAIVQDDVVGKSRTPPEAPLQAALRTPPAAPPRERPATEPAAPLRAPDTTTPAVLVPDIADTAAGAEGVPLAGAGTLDGNFRMLSVGTLTYPPRARRMRIAGEARLELEIGADGRVRRVQVLSESGDWGFGAAARAAYVQAAFSAPTVDGRPVRVLWRKTLHFRP